MTCSSRSTRRSTHELESEGLAREVAHRLQAHAARAPGYEISDRVRVAIGGDAEAARRASIRIASGWRTSCSPSSCDSGTGAAPRTDADRRESARPRRRRRSTWRSPAPEPAARLEWGDGGRHRARRVAETRARAGGHGGRRSMSPTRSPRRSSWRTSRSGEYVNVLGDLVRIWHVQNTGAAFSLFPGAIWLFVPVTVLALVMVGYFFRSLPRPRRRGSTSCSA